MLEHTDLSDLTEAQLSDAANRISALLAEARPNVDVSPGTVLNQLLIDPTALILALVEADVRKLRSSWSLRQAVENPEAVDAETIDRVLSNFRIERSEGLPAAGSLVVVISDRLTIGIPSGTIFTHADRTYRTTSANMAVVFPESVVSPTDRLIRPLADGNFAFVLPVVATEPGEAAVDREATFTTAFPIPGLVRIFAEAGFTDGIGPDTTRQLIGRMEAGLAAQSAADRASVSRLIRDAVPETLQVSLIGAGDPEQRRDAANLLGLSLGGKVDAYVRTRQLPELVRIRKEAVLLSPAGEWRVSIGRDEAPAFYRVESILPAGSVEGGSLEIVSDVRTADRTGTGFIPEVPTDRDAVYSALQAALISFEDSKALSGLVPYESRREYDLYVRIMPDIDRAHRLLTDRQTRPPAADYLAKAPIPCFTTVGLRIRYDADLVDPDVFEVQRAVADAANLLPFAAPRLSASLFVDVVHRLYGRAATVELPVGLRGTIRLPSGQTVQLTGSDALEIPPFIAQGVSRRNAAFFVAPSDVVVELVGEEDADR